MTTGVSKERLLELWKNSVDKGHLNYTEVLGWLLGEECKELGGVNQMTIGISKETLEKALLIKDCTSSTRQVLKVLISHCKELDPWLPIENAPKDRELILITEECGKVVGKWFEPPTTNGWWTANCRPVTPTHYKELP